MSAAIWIRSKENSSYEEVLLCQYNVFYMFPDGFFSGEKGEKTIYSLLQA